MPRLVYAVTHPGSADALLRGQLAFMRESGFDVTVVSAPGPELERVRDREKVDVVEVPMVRRNDARRDAISLVAMTRALRRLRPDIVNASTPKAGLLGMLAARALGVPHRIYLLRGLRLETETGALRAILAATERAASSCAHIVPCVSHSLLRAAVDGGYVPADKALVVGAGSSNGVDVERFARTPERRAEGAALMAKRGIAATDPVIVFVGRLVADKGIGELLEAFRIVRGVVPTVKLLLVGGELAGEMIDPHLAKLVATTPGVVTTEVIADLAPWYARMDVLALPSYREGFPNVALEAAAASVPVVGFRSTGVVDAVVDGVTGTLVGKRDVAELAHALLQYVKLPDRAATHGAAARRRVVSLFRREAIWGAWADFYRDRLNPSASR